MIEILLGSCWSVSYLLIVLCSIKYHKDKSIYMPLIAGAMNFGWEIHALITSKGYWVHIVWLLLDVLIISYNIYALQGWKKRALYSAFTGLCIIALYYVFRAPLINGMLISSFVIDIIMAVEYLVFIKKLSVKDRTLIGCFRLLGDLFAWIGNKDYSAFVSVAGLIVLVVNFTYAFLSLEMYYKENKTKKRSKNKNKLRKKKKR